MRYHFLAVVLVQVALFGWAQQIDPTCVHGEEPSVSSLGISSVKPDSGPFVAVDGKFMVPYQQPIPGTDVTIEMVPVPGGEFVMGSPRSEAGRNDDEGPLLKVKAAPMWIAKTESTWAQYQEYMKLHDTFQHFAAKGARPAESPTAVDAVTAPTPLYDPSFTYAFGEDPGQPAVSMTQYAAKQFTKWLSGITGIQYRLPTEAEWEYAARGGKQTAYYWGNTIDAADDHALFFDNIDTAPDAVGTKLANPFGLHDMLGSVAEWTVNQYEPDGYKRYVSRKAVAAVDVVKWPDVEDSCVVRGGSWESEPTEIRCAAKMVSDYAKWKKSDPNSPLSPWWCTEDPTRGIGLRVFRSYQPLADDVIQNFWNATDDATNDIVQFKVDDGRSYYGKVDKTLPEAIKAIDN